MSESGLPPSAVDPAQSPCCAPSIHFIKDAIMLRTPPAPAVKVKTIEQQNTDFTAEGSPPPSALKSKTQLKDTPASAVSSDVLGQSPRGNRRARHGLLGKLAAQLPHERDESIDTTGTVSSEPMKQAARDIKHGLVDTDRGADMGRTYKKLKQSH
ncbi:MAG: hypothetical protein ABI790_15415 [Betaproteobacteria bacterium]